jgi:SEC-C motif-containing protein
MTAVQKSYDTLHTIHYTLLVNIMKCPCHSEKEYHLCCGPYHKGEKPAETALLLMRSRYSAYALDLPAYIIQTTHPEGPIFQINRVNWISSIHQFSLSTKFEGLQIESFDETHVTFYATLSSFGKDVSFREKSFFKKHQGNWCYFGPDWKN